MIKLSGLILLLIIHCALIRSDEEPLFKYPSKSLRFCARIMEWTLGPHNCPLIILLHAAWDPMMGPTSKHPSKILGFCVRAIGGTLGSHKLSMHLSLSLSLSLSRFDEKLPFKHSPETLRFKLGMIEWTLESYTLFILLFLSLSNMKMNPFFLQKTQSLQNLYKETHEKGSRIATFPHPLFIMFEYMPYFMALFPYIIFLTLPFEC